MEEKKQKGIAYGVGVGPGDPEYMTLKACRLIRENDVMAVPGKVPQDAVAYKIAVQAVPELAEKELVAIDMPMEKDRELIRKSHAEAAKLIESYLDEGKNVVYLTLGDSTIYCTFSYIQHILEADGYGVELVSLHRRDGWQLWESEGWTSDLYDYVAFVDQHNDNLHYWESYKDYADELREYAADMDDEQAQEWCELAERVEGWQLEKNEVLCAPNGYPYLLLDDVEKVDRMVDHFSYDTHNYTLALDCMIEK